MESIVHQAELYNKNGEHDKTRQLLKHNLLVKKDDSELNHPDTLPVCKIDAPALGSWRVRREQSRT